VSGDGRLRPRFVKADNLVGLCTEFRSAHPSDEYAIISNRVAMLPSTLTQSLLRQRRLVACPSSGLAGLPLQGI
jgi:hypothetical protein